MDLLLECASAFQGLLNYQYAFVLGRKGKNTEVRLGFSETDFHHLVGLHKLKDISIARANRQQVFRDILAGRITYDTLEKSAYARESNIRLTAFRNIQNYLDGDQLVFRYDNRRRPGSSIESDYLLKMGDDLILDISFLFIDKSDCGVFYCRSFFPMEDVDYTIGQTHYALLKKEKINLLTGESVVQYDRLTPKQKKSGDS